jgi:hypothetical protein
MEASCIAKQFTVDNVIWCLRFACRLSKAEIHSEYLMFTVVHCKNGSVSAPQCCVIRTLPTIFKNWSFENKHSLK